ncbi:MAG: hypothetical protein ACRC6M_19485 [Microcystaceae cyanobacterium]
MTMPKTQTTPAPIANTVSSVPEGTELYDHPTPDSYDPHIIPAEVAARKEHEGKNFKHLPTHPEGPEHTPTTGGFRVDKEGLVDNFGIEPEIYYQTPGDLPVKKSVKEA